MFAFQSPPVYFPTDLAMANVHLASSKVFEETPVNVLGGSFVSGERQHNVYGGTS